MKGTKQKGAIVFSVYGIVPYHPCQKATKKHGIEPRFVGQANQRERLSQAFALPS